MLNKKILSIGKKKVLLRSRQETTPLCRGKLSVPNRLLQLKFPTVEGANIIYRSWDEKGVGTILIYPPAI